MLRTRVGYAGGTTADPTYRNIGDHTEVFQVDFDPRLISFEELLAEFWDSHNPCAPAWSTQYQAILFHHDDEQKRVAEESLERLAIERGRPITTRLVRLQAFYLAEDYHQKYALRNHRQVLADLRELFPSEPDLTNSTAAARVNAYLSGDLSFDQLRTELDKLGLRAVGDGALEGVQRR